MATSCDSYELGHVAASKEPLFDIEVTRPWPDADVKKLVDDKIESIIEATGATGLEVFLTGKGNFRNDLATIKPYKGQRVGLEKPYHWETVSQWLKDRYGATTLNGVEADDWLAIRGTEIGKNYTIASRDKDLRQVPECFHYAWACGDKQPEIGPFEVRGVGKVEAIKKVYGKKKPQVSWKLSGHGDAFFYGQLLVGDSVDNIQGVPGVGPKKAAGLLENLDTPEELFKACFYEYHKVYGDDWEKYLVENARLLHLIRNRSWIEIEEAGDELYVTCKEQWEVPYDTKDFLLSGRIPTGSYSLTEDS
jgi:hypothetical protein